MKRTLIALVLVAGASRASIPVAPASSAGDPAPKADAAKVPFEQFGKTYLQGHCKAGATAADCSFADVREQHYVHGVLGVFDVAYPAASLSEKDRVEDLRGLAKGLLDAQSHWIATVAKGDVTALDADIAVLQSWVKGWKAPLLAKAKAAPDKELSKLLEATPAQLAAAKRLTEAMLDPVRVGVAPKQGEPVRIVLAPKRREFVELLGFAGLADPTKKESLWTASASTWTSFWLDWDLVLALEYPSWKEDPEFKTGLSMNKFEPTGLVQHVVQQSMLALLWSCYGDGDALYMQQAVALNTAIAVCGEANALEGDAGRGSSGGQTAPYEQFVPGGNSGGGFLPPIPAGNQDAMKTNAWREGNGADHFAAPLRKGLKLGQKQLQKDRPDKMDPVLARDHDAHFALLGEDGSSRHLVSAPFLGPFAKEKPYPPLQFLVDYREFFRSYRTAFFHWLSIQGDPAGEEASATKYKEFLRKVAARAKDKSFEAVVQEVYALPLSGKNGETESLEWRFLKWLGKGR